MPGEKSREGSVGVLALVASLDIPKSWRVKLSLLKRAVVHICSFGKHHFWELQDEQNLGNGEAISESEAFVSPDTSYNVMQVVNDHNLSRHEILASYMKVIANFCREIINPAAHSRVFCS